MTTQEIKKQALILIEQVVILKTNVFNGCPKSKAELEKQLPRLTGIRKWADANDMTIDIRVWMSSKNWGMHRFSATELSEIFY